MKNLVLALTMLVSCAQAFAPPASSSSSSTTTRTATTTLSAGVVTVPQEWKDKAAVASAAVVTANLPVWATALAVEDDYEYGAVDAPIAIPIVGGILAIATALLPILLRPGEEAFEEVRFVSFQHFALSCSCCLLSCCCCRRCWDCFFTFLMPFLGAGCANDRSFGSEHLL